MTVDQYWIISSEAKMSFKPFSPAFLADFGSLLNPPAIEDHDRHRQTAIFGSPPARRPVGPALFFKCAVTQKGNKALSRQRHMDILEFGKAQIAAF